MNQVFKWCLLFRDLCLILTMFSGCCVWIPHYNGAWLAVCDTVTVLLGDIVLLAFENIRFAFQAQKNCIFTTAQISVYNCTKSFTTAQSVHNCTLKKTLLWGRIDGRFFNQLMVSQLFSEPTHALPVWIHCCKRLNYDFYISQGSVATVLRWGEQNYIDLRQVSSWCCMPKIINIGQCFTELFKK